MPWSEKRHCIVTCVFCFLVYAQCGRAHKTCPIRQAQVGAGPISFATNHNSPQRETHGEIRHTADTTTTVHQNTTTQAAGNRYKVGGLHILSETDLIENPRFEAHSKIGELRERKSCRVSRTKRPLHDCPSHNGRA